MSLLFAPISSISHSLGDTHGIMLILPFSELTTTVMRELLAAGKWFRERHQKVDLSGEASAQHARAAVTIRGLELDLTCRSRVCWAKRWEHLRVKMWGMPLTSLLFCAYHMQQPDSVWLFVQPHLRQHLDLIAWLSYPLCTWRSLWD